MVWLGSAGPKPVGVPRPGARVMKSQKFFGRGVLYRSYCRSLCTRMSPARISRAIAATLSGSAVRSWSPRSKALRRLADAGEPYGMSSRCTEGRSIRPGRMGSTVFPQR